MAIARNWERNIMYKKVTLPKTKSFQKDGELIQRCFCCLRQARIMTAFD